MINGFNSTMVRLKVRRRLLLNRRMPSFNSTMVRLKADSQDVSIPQWFD